MSSARMKYLALTGQGTVACASRGCSGIWLNWEFCKISRNPQKNTLTISKVVLVCENAHGASLYGMYECGRGYWIRNVPHRICCATMINKVVGGTLDLLGHTGQLRRIILIQLYHLIIWLCQRKAMKQLFTFPIKEKFCTLTIESL